MTSLRWERDQVLCLWPGFGVLPTPWDRLRFLVRRAVDKAWEKHFPPLPHG